MKGRGDGGAAAREGLIRPDGAPSPEGKVLGESAVCFYGGMGGRMVENWNGNAPHQSILHRDSFSSYPGVPVGLFDLCAPCNKLPGVPHGVFFETLVLRGFAPSDCPQDCSEQNARPTGCALHDERQLPHEGEAFGRAGDQRSPIRGLGGGDRLG